MQHDFYFYLCETKRLHFEQVGNSATLTEQWLRAAGSAPVGEWKDAQQWAGIPLEVESKPVKEISGTSNIIPLLSVPQRKTEEQCTVCGSMRSLEGLRIQHTRKMDMSVLQEGIDA